MPCSHEESIIGCLFGKHKATENGPIIAYTAELSLNCTHCGEPFCFATDMVLSDDRLSVKLSVAPGAGRFERDEFEVPGQFHCPVCMFHLSSNSWNPSTGAVVPSQSEPEPCPNGCGLLVTLTWRELSESMLRQLEQTGRRMLALERAWPEGYAMPDSQI